jgi:7-carboxy-7-deazaguanine synthase
MAKYKVVEIFTSINGEGQRAGQAAVFVRFQGCNLCCSFCDTMWANQEDAPCRILSGEEIKEQILSAGIRNITLTGGEPLMQENIGELLSILLEEDFLSVEIETNGSVFLEPFLGFRRRPVFTLDYKLAGSGMEAFMNTDNYRFLTKHDTVKFVCSDRNDLERAKEIIDTFHLTDCCKVYFSPVFGRIDPQEMAAFLLEHKMNFVTLQLQMHKIIWPPDMRGV